MALFYETEQQELNLKKEENLLQLCLNNNIDIGHACEGGASCGTCRVIITNGLEKLEKRNSLEQEMANNRNFAKNERLACQTSTKNDLSFKLPNIP